MRKENFHSSLCNDIVLTMGPIIAIIGRPNVGKSSLFNKLIGEDRAIVADFSGLTRDRLYGNFSVKEQRFSIVDTGGISDQKEEINQDRKSVV